MNISNQQKQCEVYELNTLDKSPLLCNLLFSTLNFVTCSLQKVNHSHEIQRKH